MATFVITMQVAIEIPHIDDGVVADVASEIPFIKDEICMGPVEGMKILEDGGIGKMLPEYNITVEHREKTDEI